LKAAAGPARAGGWWVPVGVGRRQGGQSAIEYLIVFPMLIMLLFGVIQWSLIYQARAVVNHATLLAARAGAMHNGNARQMRNAFGAGIAPLFATEPSDAKYVEAVAKGTFDAHYPNILTLKVVNPTENAFRDFERPKLNGNGGTEIPNDTLQYRSTTVGTQSQVSIQDANVLHLRTTYCYRMYVPVVNNVISTVANALWSFDDSLQAHGMSDPFGIGGDEADFEVPWNDTCNFFTTKREPRIKITSEAVVRMQSPYFRENYPP
jgi:Flp pilus assembly protein TadG